MHLLVEDFESMAPVILSPQRVPMTDEEFVAFCRQSDDCFVECTAEGEIIIMPPPIREPADAMPSWVSRAGV